MNKIGEVAYYLGCVIGSIGIGFAIYEVFIGAGMTPMGYTVVVALYGLCPILAGYVIRGVLAHNWSVFSTRPSAG